MKFHPSSLILCLSPITSYLEGALSPAEHARFEAHLTTCTGCTRYLEQIRQTIRLAGKLTEEAIAPYARQELLQVFRNWKSGGTP